VPGLLPILIGFLIGEVILFILIFWGYNKLSGSGIIPAHSRMRGRILLAALLLPALYALIGTFGFFAVRAAPGVSIPELVGLPAAGPPDPIAPEPDSGDTIDPTQAAGVPAEETPSTLAPPTPTNGDAAGEIPPGKIVYACQIFKTGLRDQICLINSDGTGYRRLSREDLWDHNFPSLSPDGKSIVYVAQEPAEFFQVYEMNLDSGAYWALTQADGTTSAPEISPDGLYIVYNQIWESSNTIWVMERDGSNPQMIFGLPRGSGWDPVWSSDGRSILFASDRAGGIQLFTIEPDGTNLNQITNLPDLRGRSDWSPDGQTIATYTGPPWEREIVIISADGSNPRLITSGGNNLAPSFSPDGQWITFTSYRDKYREDLGCEIYVMRIDGSGVTRLTYDDICNWQPRWGP
jgi:TolB protein